MILHHCTSTMSFSANSDGDEEKELKVIESLFSKQVDGIV